MDRSAEVVRQDHIQEAMRVRGPEEPQPLVSLYVHLVDSVKAQQLCGHCVVFKQLCHHCVVFKQPEAAGKLHTRQRV